MQQTKTKQFLLTSKFRLTRYVAGSMFTTDSHE